MSFSVKGLYLVRVVYCFFNLILNLELELKFLPWLFFLNEVNLIDIVLTLLLVVYDL